MGKNAKSMIRSLTGLSASLALLATLGCTQGQEGKSAVTIQFPAATSVKSASAPTGANTTVTTAWNSALNPTAVSQINCYAIFVGASDLNTSSCTPPNSNIARLTFGPYVVFTPAGQAASLSVPVGAARTITVVGLVASPASACTTQTNNSTLNKLAFSQPQILGSSTTDLSPGNVTVDVDISMHAASDFIEDCKLAGLNLTDPSPTPSPTPIPTTATSAQISLISTLNTAGSNTDIVVDTSGNVYYLDINNSLVMKVSPAGVQSELTDYESSGGYGTLAIDSNNTLYVAFSNVLMKVSPGGTMSSFATFPSGTGPLNMKVDASGNIYYTEWSGSYVSTNIIKKITPSGVVSTWAGSGAAGHTDSKGVGATFNNPSGLAIDSLGNVYVADIGNSVIRRIDSTANVTTFAGSGTQASVDGVGTGASFYLRPTPAAYLAIDSSDNLYVGDNNFYTGYIRKVTNQAVATTYCGNGSMSTNVVGLCSGTGVWVNMGMALSSSGVIYYVSGATLYSIAPSVTAAVGSSPVGSP